ncbi:hypothetical protein K2X33_15775 [bacterium]|nr:hypothetical protein [bacterium]
MDRKRSYGGLLLLAVLFSPPAWGYIDPGTSGVILQLVLGGAIGALFYLRKVITFVARMFRRESSNG